MNPQNQYVDNGKDPYAFIMDPQKPPKKKMFSDTNPLVMKLIFILGGGFMLLVIISIALSNLSGKSGVNVNALVGIAQSQQEIIRVSTLASSGATQQTTKNLAITTQLSMRTQQSQTLTVLAGEGKKLKSKDLALKQNAATDQQLATARQTSTFDLVFSQILEKQLSDYASSVKRQYELSTSEKVRDTLSTHFEQAQLLISQIPYTQKDIQGATE